MAVLFLSHPEVVIDPAIPVPLWSLSDVGTARTRALARRLPRPAAIWTSPEAKAIETAGLVAAPHGLGIAVDHGLAELDRSSTGYVPHDRHGAIADACFAAPEASAEGWERAIDAQARILAAFRRIVGAGQDGLVILVGHGGTGTLLWCALAALAIARVHDQPCGGCAWAVGRPGFSPVFAWTPFERAADALGAAARAA